MKNRVSDFSKSLLVLTAIFCVFHGSMAQATTFTVTSTADPGDSTCGVANTGDGCTLREAISAANSAAGDDAINFAPGISGMITLSSTLPDLTTNLDIQGPGKNVLTISGNNANRIFVIKKATITVEDLTMANGASIQSPSASAAGGAILNYGALTLRRCTLRDNFAQGTQSFGGAFGGAIYNDGYNSSTSLTLVDCSLVANQTKAVITPQYVPTYGGAIASSGYQGSCVLICSGCTFADNVARESDTGAGISSYGGVFYNSTNVNCVFTNCTFARNRASAGGVVYSYSSDVSFSHCTVSGNWNSRFEANITSKDTSGPATLNLKLTIVSGNTGGLVLGYSYSPNDYNFFALTNIGLGPLQDNGGPTQTMALLPDSPALNAGDPNYHGPPTTDQRGAGFPRVSGGRIDIGAYEVPALTVRIAPGFSKTFSEGAGANATKMRITRDGPNGSDLTVNLRTSDVSEATIQPNVLIPAGQTFVDVPVNAVNDTLVDGIKQVLVKASQTGYFSAKATLEVLDDETPLLSATLSPTAFVENKTGTATTLNLSRGVASNTLQVTINLNSSDTRLNVPTTATIPAGRREVNVPITVTPDIRVQGTLQAVITASAAGYITATTSATIYDAEAALTLSVIPGSPTTLTEGPNNTTTILRVTRNTPTTSAVIVALSFRRGVGQVALPATVTIPAGQPFTDFMVSAVDDTTLDGTQSVSLQASVPGYKAASAQLFVTDNDQSTSNFTDFILAPSQ